MTSHEPNAMRLLLIEDDPDHVELILHALRGQPLIESIDHVADGVEGLAYLRGEGEHAGRTVPDMVLLDLKLPRKDGLEVLREIKADPELRAIPIVVLTTSDAEADVTAAYRSHVNSYLVKPVEYARFRELIENVSNYWGEMNRRPRDQRVRR